MPPATGKRFARFVGFVHILGYAVENKHLYYANIKSIRGRFININIPGYRVVRQIGRGGMATVYLAIQENFQREVALKVMSPVLSEGGDFSERFLREARIVSRLVHPHIVTVHDVGIQNGHHYLSMEYIEGHDLRERLASLNGEQILRVTAEVAKALDYAGRKGYVHRDVKPENIMIHDQDGRAILMDFGIARAADSVSTMTRTGTALGTPHYMSPEQARGHAIDGRSDLYSLGVLLHFMLTGKVPYDADSPVAVGIKHISAKLPQLPAPLSEYQFLIDKLMAKSPADRFQSGSELVAALAKVNGRAADRWRPKVAFEFLGSHEHTPVRSEQVSSLGDEVMSAKTGAGEAVSVAIVKGANDTYATDSQPQETLHIPREDLEARKVGKKGSVWLALLPVVLVLLLVAGYTFHRSGQLQLPAQLTALLPPNIVAWLQPVKGRAVESESTPGAVVSDAASRPNSLDDNSPTDPAIEIQTGTGADHTSTDTQPDATSDDWTAESVEALLLRSQALASIVSQQPERKPELLSVYRLILEAEPQQAEVLAQLEGLQQQALASVEQQLDAGELDEARLELDTALAWFPEFSDQQQYTALEQRLERAENISELLQLAENYLSRNRLLLPEGDNAKQTFDRVLQLDADNQAAKQGLQQIVVRYAQLTRGAINRQDYAKAMQLASSGLSIDANSKELLSLSSQLEKRQQQQQAISQLLAEAAELDRQQHWFGEQNSAVQKYLQVLALDAGQRQANDGLNKIVEDFSGEIDGLMAIRDYELASSQVAQALQLLPNNSQLAFLMQQLQTLAPAISQLTLSGSPLSAEEQPLARRVTADRTLYIAFQFSNLSQPTTVFQAVLFDGGRSVQIAGVPVVVVGNEGRAQFRINRPVEGYTAGGYHLDILLAGEQIFSHAFIIESK